MGAARRRGVDAVAGPDAVRVRTSVVLRGDGRTAAAEFTVAAGDTVPFVLTWYRSYAPVSEPVDARDALRDTLAGWWEWAGRCTYRGPWRDLVVRSFVTLKALTYAPSGGIVAAATTSLPEQPGGVRNWDYRYCWLRDATLSLLSLLHAGYTDEAAAWRAWLHRAVAGDPSTLQIMYAVDGERRLTEWEVAWLPGYEGAKPMRVGNAARGQFQLDVYGEVADALYQARLHGVEPAPAAWGLETALTEFVADHWDDPDDGIWEVRGPRRQFTHSKVMAWVALDLAVKTAERFGLDAPVARWKKARRAVHARVCRDGFSEKCRAFVQAFGSDKLDASLLMVPLVGFLPPDDPRVAGTVAAIEKHLTRDEFVLRYETASDNDGLPPGEGRSSRARSGWPTTTPWQGTGTRPVRCSSGPQGCATTSGC